MISKLLRLIKRDSPVLVEREEDGRERKFTRGLPKRFITTTLAHALSRSLAPEWGVRMYVCQDYSLVRALQNTSWPAAAPPYLLCNHATRKHSTTKQRPIKKLGTQHPRLSYARAYHTPHAYLYPTSRTTSVASHNTSNPRTRRPSKNKNKNTFFIQFLVT